MGFTLPIREKAVAHLALAGGAAVLDVGCGTGASFAALQRAVGPGGSILGIEPSSSMLAVARQRVQRAGWQNVTLCESTIEAFDSAEQYDGALLFAMHDVFNSLPGLQKIHALLKDGARITCVGPKTQQSGAMRLFNPMLRQLFRRMALAQANQDKPWRLAGQVFNTEAVLEEKHGLIFIYVGRK
jgi:ubiquinone/menaquinone biosynthesis C-methylase UbiE